MKRTAVHLTDLTPNTATWPDAVVPAQTRPDPRHRALRLTLSIMQAQTEDELLVRTLAAACELTGAAAAAAVRPDGRHLVQGAADLAATLCTLDLTAHPAQGHVCAALGDILVVVAAGEHGLHPDAAGLLALIVAHAQAGRDRLRELAMLSRRADSDPLTGLRHHRPFSERLAASVPDRTAVVTIDVDCFKKINDVYGHQAGDDALVRLVDALRAALRDGDTLYRIGGDEFAVVVDVNGVAEAEAIAARLLDAARQVGPTISVGVALRRDDESGRETLLRADMAMYEAKRAGKNTMRLAP